MGKNRGYILLDPIKDKKLLPIFNELKNKPVVTYDYNNGKTKDWVRISGKIGMKCKELIDTKPPLMYPPSSSRPHNLGFITKPEDVELESVPFKGKQKIVYNRKIF